LSLDLMVWENVKSCLPEFSLNPYGRLVTYMSSEGRAYPVRCALSCATRSSNATSGLSSNERMNTCQEKRDNRSDQEWRDSARTVT
jgi:hypothetical protein